MDQPVLLSETDDRGVVTVTLNRPAVNNAYDGALVEALLQEFTRLGADARARAVVIRARGRHFQAGADLDWLRSISTAGPDANLAASRQTLLAVHGLTCLPQPTIALVHGACVGGGTGIAAACDVAIAAADAWFAISEARRGMVASIIVPHLNAAMGVRNVRRYALTGERFDALAAQRMGLVHEVCEADQLEARGAAAVDELLRSAPEATRVTKWRALEAAGLHLDDAALEALVAEHAGRRRSDEAAEGFASFVDRRDPAWYPGST